jgi:putative redox protein
MHREQSMQNDLIREKVAGMVERLRARPGASVATFRVTTRLEQGLRCSAQVRNLPPIAVDEPARIGGTDQGMNPVELLLAAMGTCQEIMYAVHAAIQGISLEDVSVQCTGNLDLRGLFGVDDSVPAGLTAVEYETRISSGASPDQIAALSVLVESRCPVMDTLSRPVRANGSVYLNGKRLAGPHAADTE